MNLHFPFCMPLLLKQGHVVQADLELIPLTLEWQMSTPGLLVCMCVPCVCAYTYVTQDFMPSRRASTHKNPAQTLNLLLGSPERGLQTGAAPFFASY